MNADKEHQLAQALIHRHGMRAGAVAREHAAQSLAAHDNEAATNWGGVARAVDQLRADGRAAA